MVTDLRIYVIIGIFTMVCISMMVFNFGIIYHRNGNKDLSPAKVEKWRGIIYVQALAPKNLKLSERRHEKFLRRKLPSAEKLILYAAALQRLKNEFPESYYAYAEKKHEVFLELADVYGRKSRIDRTCYADFISNFPELVGNVQGRLADVLISYIEDSCIYCRTKVLSALCSVGHLQGVANVLQVIHDRELFMHNRLLTTELLKFRGDQKILGELLWNKSNSWNDSITVSVIQFITKISDGYSEIFFQILLDASANLEVRIAAIRYYGEHEYEPAHRVLIDFIENPPDIDLAIAAAEALVLYPSSGTIAVLKAALASPDWHVRYNASATLVKLGNREEILRALEDGREHEKEIVAYMLELEGALEDEDFLRKTEGEILTS